MPDEPEEQELLERWSARQKTDIVLRLLRSEDLGAVSREIQVPPQELEEWRVFLESGARGLKRSGRITITPFRSLSVDPRAREGSFREAQPVQAIGRDTFPALGAGE